MVKFIFFAEARTGGTHIIDMLNSHQNILAVGEPFVHLNLKTNEEQLEWIMNDHLVKSIKNKEILFRGFRTKLEHIAIIKDFEKFLNRENYICFSVLRENIVKQAVSRIRAIRLFKLTEDYNVRDKTQKLDAINIPFKDLMAQIDYCTLANQNYLEFKNQFNLPIRELYYEDLLTNEDQFFKSILKTLGAPFSPLVTRTYKNTSDNLKDSILNFEELRSCLINSPYHRMLNEIILMS